MAKFIKPFRGVPEGEIYPVRYAAGEECPPELEAGALSLGALPSNDGGADKESLIQQLEAAGIPYDKRWGAEKLAAALAEGKKE